MDLKLSANEIEEDGLSGDDQCHWRLLVPCPNETNLILPERRRHKFDDFSVTQFKKSKFRISVNDEVEEAGAVHDLHFINSCDIESDEEVQIPIEDLDEQDELEILSLQVYIREEEDSEEEDEEEDED